MPNGIKYTVGSTEAGCLRKGNMLITNNIIDYGSSFYAGINPPANGYTIYLNKGSNGPSIYCPTNDTQLIAITKQISGTTYASAAQCLNYFATQTDKVVIASKDNIPASVTSGSVLNLDANLVCSYPTTALTWYDVSGNNKDFSLNNGPTYSNGALIFDGTDDFVFNSDLKYSPFSFDVTFKGNNNNGYIARLTGYGWGMFIPSANIVNVWVDTDTNHRSTTTGISYNGNLVTNISVVFANSAFSLYKNGVFLQTVSTPSSSIYSTTTQFRLATDGGGTGFFSGSIYSAKMYNRALTAAEISQNYYQAPIVTNGLALTVDAGNVVSYESGSTTMYSLTGSASGSLFNGTSYSNVNGGAWSFDGVDDYATANLPSSFLGNPVFSIGGWFKRSGTWNAGATWGIGNGGSNINSYCWSFDNTIGIDLYGNTTFNTFETYSLTEWKHIIWTYNGSTFTNTNVIIYINGVPYTGSSLSVIRGGGGTIPNVVGNSLALGRVSSNENQYYGKPIIGNFQMYNRVLSQAEVLQNFNAQRNRFGI